MPFELTLAAAVCLGIALGLVLAWRIDRFFTNRELRKIEKRAEAKCPNIHPGAFTYKRRV